MVCDKCQEKLPKLATPDVWDKDNKNKKSGMILPSFNKNKFDPMGQNKKKDKYKKTKSFVKIVLIKMVLISKMKIRKIYF